VIEEGAHPDRIVKMFAANPHDDASAIAKYCPEACCVSPSYGVQAHKWKPRRKTSLRSRSSRGCRPGSESRLPLARFQVTTPPELRFCALLSNGTPEVHLTVVSLKFCRLVAG
jgi:hypothetical protein